ncbi:hypothetical protein HK102_009161, partial [Quaeritorhiza haematococci]
MLHQCPASSEEAPLCLVEVSDHEQPLASLAIDGSGHGFAEHFDETERDAATLIMETAPFAEEQHQHQHQEQRIEVVVTLSSQSPSSDSAVPLEDAPYLPTEESEQPVASVAIDSGGECLAEDLVEKKIDNPTVTEATSFPAEQHPDQDQHPEIDASPSSRAPSSASCLPSEGAPHRPTSAISAMSEIPLINEHMNLQQQQMETQEGHEMTMAQGDLASERNTSEAMPLHWSQPNQ